MPSDWAKGPHPPSLDVATHFSVIGITTDWVQPAADRLYIRRSSPDEGEPRSTVGWAERCPPRGKEVFVFPTQPSVLEHLAIEENLPCAAAKPIVDLAQELQFNPAEDE